MFNALDEFFAPGSKHTDEERNRLALTRTDVGESDPSRGPIDLASGKVTVRGAAAPLTTDGSTASGECPALAEKPPLAAVLPPVPRVHRSERD
ncbi:DUF6191 domain-containing protein [Streptomyces albipurpureus]|uniref:DUF6191 domain-containing protein n=1 Tax=Streptomyces albipurpureus TaxID=2897419 RepID=A0ABT0UJG9_9ACTN|nr:DUF6191 domain-containing protein [Streptomyces sp. CWNU-1]MCM2387745.1 DUF6191 domain-containing protein [Streptomyces sp. CWNU-1]